MKSKLNELVSNGLIKTYGHVGIDENGNITKLGDCRGSRNTERLTLVFNDDTEFVIDTICSGCAENTAMYFS